VVVEGAHAPLAVAEDEQAADRGAAGVAAQGAEAIDAAGLDVVDAQGAGGAEVGGVGGSGEIEGAELGAVVEGGAADGGDPAGPSAGGEARIVHGLEASEGAAAASGGREDGEKAVAAEGAELIAEAGAALRLVDAELEVDGAGGREVAVAEIEGALAGVDPPDQLGDHEVHVDVAVAVDVGGLVEDHAVDRDGDVGAVGGVEAAEEDLLAFALGAVLDRPDARDEAEQVVGAAASRRGGDHVGLDALLAGGLGGALLDDDGAVRGAWVVGVGRVGGEGEGEGAGEGAGAREAAQRASEGALVGPWAALRVKVRHGEL
jgi:hypothetical protein